MKTTKLNRIAARLFMLCMALTGLFIAQARAAADEYYLQSNTTKCSASYNFCYEGTTDLVYCKCAPGTTVTVKLTVTPQSGYEFNRVEIRDSYSVTSGNDLSEEANLQPVAGEEMTWTFVMPEKPASAYAVLHVICTAIPPKPSVALTSTAAEIEYDTNNVRFNATVTDKGAELKVGTVQFYLNNEAAGDPVSYVSTSYYPGYTGFYKTLQATDEVGTLRMGENSVYAVYTYTDGTTAQSDTVTVTLLKQDITSILTRGTTIDTVYYTGEYRNIALIGWLSSSYWKERINKDSFDLSLTKDGQPYDDLQYTEMGSGTTFNFIAREVGKYTYTATVKEADPHYRGTISTVGEIVGRSTHTVSFNANGGTGTMAPVTVEEGAYPLPANGFTAPNGRRFDGWALSADGPVLTGAYTVTANTTLYARWKVIPVETTGKIPVVVSPASDQTVTVNEGQQGVLTVSATEATEYQWYVNRNDGRGYVAVSGANGASHTTDAAAQENDGYTYYCVAYNAYGDAQSSTFTLRVRKAQELPKTGDDANPALWLALFALSAGAAVILIIHERKRIAR